VDADRVDVGRRDRRGDGDVAFPGPLEEAEEDVARARAALFLDEAVEGLQPFARLLGVVVGHLAEQTVDEGPRLVSW